MGKLILQSQISIDGLIAESGGATDWLVWDWGQTWNWDDELKREFTDTIATVGCILLSRRMAEGGFFEHWEKAAEDPSDPRFAYASTLNGIRKAVFTKSLRESAWPNTELARGELSSEIRRLKSQVPGNLIAYGGAAFVSSLITADLVDEYQLFVNPAILGDGMPIFRGLGRSRNMALVSAKPYGCGIAVLKYVTKDGRGPAG